jgi:hypothetical protein|nr:MAG TPA: hypothetical protein [Microviridae sp.]
MNEENYTEQYKGIIMLRKGRKDDEDIWFATVGNQLVSDGAYKTKEELIESLENLNLGTVCKIISGAFGRMIELSNKNGKQ